MNIFKRPMFFAAISAVLVTAISLYYFKIAALIVAVIFVLLLFSIIKFGAKYIIVLLAFLLFVLSLFLEKQKINIIKNIDNKIATGEFVVLSEPTQYEKFNLVTLKVKNSKVLPKNTKYTVFDNSKSTFSMGDTVIAKVKVNVIEEDDEYRFYNYGNSVYATLSMSSFERLNKTNHLYKLFGNVQRYVKSKLNSFFDGDTSGLLIALTLGDKTNLSDKFLNNVKTTGISHIIVVSGMHLSIIMAVIFIFIDRLFYNKYLRSLISVFSVMLIMGVCGFTMSVVRAGVMFIVAGLAPVFNRENDLLNSLFTAITFVLIATPFAIFNVSFQLSVVSTLALILVLPFYRKTIIDKLKISSKPIRVILDIVLCSIFVTIFTLPIIIKIFGYVSIVAPLTNLVVTFPTTIMLIFNVLALLLSAVPILRILSIPLF